MDATPQRFAGRHSSISEEPISPYRLESHHSRGASLFGRIESHDQLNRLRFSNGNPCPEGFLRLPSEVILRILWMVAADQFASLALLNRTWYEQAQKTELYAHHLSRCPSYALTNHLVTGPFRRNDLFRLKTKFAAEVRRNLFEAYMRPRSTVVNLISTNTNSSAAYPGGEVFRFSFSPNGQTLLALSSSRIYVMDVTSDPIEVRKELKTLRRPLAASITDDGSLLAVLSSKYQTNIYALTDDGVKHLQVLVMENPPRTIALAHEGTVLAAAYEGGVEVFSLAANALSTDRRAVRSEAVDTLLFSGDGSMLVGSSQSLDEPNAIVITAPFYTENDPDLSSREIHSRMWTTQILFPQVSSVSSHVELLQAHTEGETNWLFAYDHSLMSFRAVRTDDTRTGVAYFLNPPTTRRFSMPSPSMAPTATACGTLVVAGFAGTGLWIYGVPERLDVSPDMGSVVERHEQRVQTQVALTSATGIIEPLMAYSPSMSGSSEEIEEDPLASKVDWRQSLFVKCRAVKSIEGAIASKWVEHSENRESAFAGKRLVVVAPGGVNKFDEEIGDEVMPVDGSRICLLDFDYTPGSGEDREITIEVGDKEPELLTEHSGSLDVEVALERRRTVRGGRQTGLALRGALGRSVTTAVPGVGNPLNEHPRRTSTSQPSSPSEVHNENAFNQPARSPPSSLHRSATAGAFYTARYPPRPPLGTPMYQSSGHVIYNRPLRRRDSEDSWETPPPPYSAGSPVQWPPQPAGPQLTAWQELQNARMATQRNANQNHLSPNAGASPLSQPSTIDQSPPNNLENVGRDSEQLSPSRNPQQAAGQVQVIPRRPLNNTNLEPVSEGVVVRPYNNEQRQADQADINSPVSPDNYFTRNHHAPYENRPQPDGTLPLGPTLTHPISPPTPDRHNVNRELRILVPPASHAQKSSTSSITLTGANLQNRLNHPVPPTPDEHQQRQMAGYMENRTEDSAGSTSTPNSQNRNAERNVDRNAEHYAIAPPTVDQMANLNRRSSQLQGHSQFLPQHESPTHASDVVDYARPTTSPPRGAWGASGIPGSPSFNRAINAPNGLSRNNSRGSHPSIPTSASTPNLLSSQRPRYDRLDTIESVPDSLAPPIASGMRDRLNSTGHDMVFQHHDDDTRAHTEPIFSDSRRRKPKRRKGGNRHDDPDSPQNNSAPAKEKKGSRCTVM